MESIVHADVFFFVTTISVVLVTTILLVALFHAVHILQDIRHITRRVREKSDSILKDAEALRVFLKIALSRFFKNKKSKVRDQSKNR